LTKVLCLKYAPLLRGAGVRGGYKRLGDLPSELQPGASKQNTTLRRPGRGFPGAALLLCMWSWCTV